MMIAGIGLRTGALAEDITKAIDEALRYAKTTRDQLDALATLDEKSSEQGLCEAAKGLRLPVKPIGRDRLEQVSNLAITNSKLSMSATGLPSLAETAALAAIGDGAKLLGPRVKSATATCALATKSEETNP